MDKGRYDVIISSNDIDISDVLEIVLEKAGYEADVTLVKFEEE